ncbi:unnamed protein product, partial [Scytosiphon promiscuus]
RRSLCYSREIGSRRRGIRAISRLVSLHDGGVGAICGDLCCRTIEILVKSKHMETLATA